MTVISLQLSVNATFLYTYCYLPTDYCQLKTCKPCSVYCVPCAILQDNLHLRVLFECQVNGVAFLLILDGYLHIKTEVLSLAAAVGI